MLSRPIEQALLNTTFTNSLLLSFSPETLETFLKNGPPIKSPNFCRQCKIYPTISNVKKTQEGYSCDCGKNLKKENLTKINEQSIPEYFIENDEEDSEKKEILILCCFDYSGSMGKTYKTPNNEEIQTYAGYLNMLSTSSGFGEGQYSEETITRKTLMLFHVKKQLEKLMSKKIANISYKIFVITFSNVIKLFGDGVTSELPIILEAKNLEQIQDMIVKCKKFGKTQASNVYSGQVNLDKLFRELEKEMENGSTSLGPAIAIGLGVVEKLKPKACQFLIFTDGLASNGLGNIEDGLQNSEILEQSKEHYKNLGDIGYNFRVVFHMFAFKDETAGFSITTGMIDKTIYGELSQVKILKKNNTYDHEMLNDAIEKALNLSRSLYCVPSSDYQSLKIFFNKGLKVEFCEKDKENTGIEDYYIYKKIGPIYRSENQNLKIGIKYDLEGKFKENEKIFLQIQLIFNKIEDGREKTFVFNLDYDVKKQLSNNLEIDFNALTPIMFRDDIENEKNAAKLLVYQNFVRERGSPADSQILAKFLEPPQIKKEENKEEEEEEEKKSKKNSNWKKPESSDSDSDENTIRRRREIKKKAKELDDLTEKRPKKK